MHNCLIAWCKGGKVARLTENWMRKVMVGKGLKIASTFASTFLYAKVDANSYIHFVIQSVPL